MTDDMLTVMEVAQRLRISRVRMYALVADGTVPSVRLSPRRIRIPRRAFEAWLAEKNMQALASVHDDGGRDE